MRGTLLLLAFAATVRAEDPPRHVERTGQPKIPKVHSAEQAGTDAAAGHLQPSNPPRTVLGYVNGMTFGKDYVGIFHRPGRVFPGLWPRSKSYSDKYATDGHIHVPDLVAEFPSLRKAIKEAKEARETKEANESKSGGH